MAHFMPVDQQKAERLNERLGKTMFRSVENFVEFYNSGIINKNHEDVANIATEITKTYRDVKERNKRLIFISESEVHLNEIYSTLDTWSILIKIKRDLQQHISDGELTEGGTVLFTPEAIGYVTVMNEDGELDKLSVEKLFSRHANIVGIYEQYSSRKDGEKAAADVYQFAVSDFTNLDDSFVTRIKEELPN